MDEEQIKIILIDGVTFTLKKYYRLCIDAETESICGKMYDIMEKGYSNIELLKIATRLRVLADFIERKDGWIKTYNCTGCTEFVIDLRDKR